MSKIKNKPEVKNETAPVKTEAPDTFTPDDAPPDPVVSGDVSTPTATALATVATAELASSKEEFDDDGVTCVHLVKDLPHKAKTFRRLHIASEDEYETARAALTPAAQERFDELMDRLTPEAAFETGSRGFRPQTIKLKQGTSNDENCPEMCDSGGLYTSDGIVLTAPTEARAKKGGVTTGIYVSLIAGWKGRVLFAPRVNNKVLPLKEFGDAKTEAPYCRSMDRLVGAPVKNVQGIGKCPECPYRPWKTQGEPNLCNDTVTCIFVVLRKEEDGRFTCFDGLYEMTFARSAAPTGNHIQALAEKGRDPWERILRISVKEEKGKAEGVYFIPEASGVTNEENGKPMTVSREDSAMLKLLRDQMLVSYYYPSLAGVYRREEQVRTGGAVSSTQTRTDMSELERRAAEAAGETPRASTDMRDANV